MGKKVHLVNSTTSSDTPIRIQQAVIDRVAEHARASYAADEEACGYLTGPSSAPFDCDESVELKNLANR